MENSKREIALRALFTVLQEGLPDIKVLRNEVLNVVIPKTGLVILRDGIPGEPEITLSPTRYVYQHEAYIEVLTQIPATDKRDDTIDKILFRVGDIIAQNRLLDNSIDYMYTLAPELITEPVEGAASIKTARIPIYLEYWTDNPLQ